MASLAVHFGWGKTSSLIETKDQMEKVRDSNHNCSEPFEVDDTQAAYSADALYVTTLVLSKISTSVFYRTITGRSSQWILHVLLVIIALWGPAALILSTVRCSSSPWQDINHECKILVRDGLCCCRTRHSYSLDLVSPMAGDHGFGHHS